MSDMTIIFCVEIIRKILLFHRRIITSNIDVEIRHTIVYRQNLYKLDESSLKGVCLSLFNSLCYQLIKSVHATYKVCFLSSLAIVEFVPEYVRDYVIKTVLILVHLYVITGVCAIEIVLKLVQLYGISCA